MHADPRIVITENVWGTRTIVSIEPRVVTHPSREFLRAEDALAYVDDLARQLSAIVEDRRQFQNEEVGNA